MNHPDYLRWKALLETHLLSFLPEVDDKSNTLYDAMCYSLEAGGKRIRPVLLLAACHFSGGEEKSAIPYACALEYIHTYSLIHDDLPAMDDDDLRRGRPTNHKVFGEAMAILAGDGLLNAAFEAMNKDMFHYFDDPIKLKQRVKASYDIVKAAGCRGMIAGQVADMEAEGRQSTKELLDYIYLNKTGALLSAAVSAGARLGKSKPEEHNDLVCYAEKIGLAFQIIDDILDVCGNQKEMGKNAGSDARTQKSTYPSLHGIETSKQAVRSLTEEAVRIMDQYGDRGDFFKYLAIDLENRIC